MNVHFEDFIYYIGAALKGKGKEGFAQTTNPCEDSSLPGKIK